MAFIEPMHRNKPIITYRPSLCCDGTFILSFSEHREVHVKWIFVDTIYLIWSFNFFFCYRCGKLKKLILNTNRLITLPDAFHFLTDLEVGNGIHQGNPVVIGLFFSWSWILDPKWIFLKNNPFVWNWCGTAVIQSISMLYVSCCLKSPVK